jgi:hypothetical protein
VKQAAGKEAIPPGNQPNFEEYEPAFRFGYGASQHYGKEYPKWDDRLEKTLRKPRLRIQGQSIDSLHGMGARRSHAAPRTA